MDERALELLEEIRRLLVPVSVVAEPQYQEIMQQRNAAAIKSILEIVGRSKVQLNAAKQMTGKMSAAEIRSETGFDPSNYSKFLKKLRDAKVLSEKDGKVSLAVDPDAIKWPDPA